MTQPENYEYNFHTISSFKKPEFKPHLITKQIMAPVRREGQDATPHKNSQRLLSVGWNEERGMKT